MALCLGGFAKLYSYFKVGAEQIDLVSKAQKESSIHDPAYTWDLSESKEGVLLDEYTRQEIQDAYTLAWYILNTSIAKQKDLGLADRYSKKMISKIEGRFDEKSSTYEERADLNHNIKVHLYSYDRQLISFSDTNVKLVRKTTNIETGVAEQFEDIMHFDVVMGLEDGYWKIFDIVQLDCNTKAEEGSIQLKNKVELTEKIKGVNYYPADNPWFDFWKNYDKQIVQKDLALLKGIGFNHTRIFIPYELFGKASLDSTMVHRLDDFLNQCQKQNITSTLSLFDFPESYHLPYYPATRRHLLQLLDRYQNHPAVKIWDLKNEADLDFENYGQEVVINWLDFMIREARTKAPNINLTIGWSKVDYVDLLSEHLDLQSFHLYGDIDQHHKHLRKLKEQNKIIKPLYLSEFGMTSYRSTILPFGSTKKQQAVFTKEVLEFVNEEKIDHYAFWTLHDFKEAPKEVIGWKPWIRKAQENMGLIGIDGIEKPVLNNFTDGTDEIESLRWYEQTQPIYLIIPLLLILLYLISFKSKI